MSAKSEGFSPIFRKVSARLEVRIAFKTPRIPRYRQRRSQGDRQLAKPIKVAGDQDTGSRTRAHLEEETVTL